MKDEIPGLQSIAAAVAPSVLLVNNDRALLEGLLKAGLLCRRAADAEATIQAVEGSSFDLVVLDTELSPQPLGLISALHRARPQQSVLVLVAGEGVSDDHCCLCRENVGVITRVPDTARMQAEIQRRVSESRQRRFDWELYRHVQREVSSWSFRTNVLAFSKFRVPALEGLERAGRLTPAERQRLELAIDEALANSIEHGNLGLKSPWREEYDDQGHDKFSSEKAARLKQALYADREVEVRCEITPEWLTLSIQDHGDGFAPATDVSQKSAGAPPKLFGRGLALIEAGVDELTYAEGGTKIVMRKRLQADSKPQ